MTGIELTFKDMDKKTILAAMNFSGRSFHNEEILKTATKCGCYCCCTIFSPSEIKRWTDNPPRTAICPYCGVDSVLDEGAFTPFNKSGLRAISEVMF